MPSWGDSFEGMLKSILTSRLWITSIGPLGSQLSQDEKTKTHELLDLRLAEHCCLTSPKAVHRGEICHQHACHGDTSGDLRCAEWPDRPSLTAISATPTPYMCDGTICLCPFGVFPPWYFSRQNWTFPFQTFLFGVLKEPFWGSKRTTGDSGLQDPKTDQMPVKQGINKDCNQPHPTCFRRFFFPPSMRTLSSQVSAISMVFFSRFSSTLEARATRHVTRANRFARIIRNWNPYFFSASGWFAWITRISDSRESPDSRESCESIRANHATKSSTFNPFRSIFCHFQSLSVKANQFQSL